MKKQKHLRIICWIVLMIVGIWQFAGRAEPLQAQYGPGGTPVVGRDNPFAKLPQVKTIPQKILQPSPLGQQTAELFVETVTLQYLDADSLSEAIEGLSSEYGSISINERTNSLIICDTKEYLERILTQIQRAEETMTSQNVAIADQNTPELFVETVTLKFLDAKNLQTAIEGMSSAYGIVSADIKTNSLIICDTKENVERILAEVRKADETPQQIMVEVVILDVQLNDDTEIGINWDILSDENYDYNYRQNFTTTRLGTTVESASTIGNATAFATTGLGGDFSVISGTVRNIVHLVQQKRDVEILASPRVMMVSGQSATIDAIEELPYTEVMDTSQGGAGALTSTDFKDVGVKLQVSATLIDGNDILLTVDAEQNVTTGMSDTEVPIVDTRKASTVLLLKDGQIVVFGGLRRQEKTKEVDQIPFIGDLPIIGELFKSTQTVIRNSELIVFLSPRVYKQEPIDDDEMTKFKEITERPLLSLPDDDNSKENDDKLEKRLKEQSQVNETLQEEISERKRSEDELREYLNQFKNRVTEQTANNERLQEQITEQKQSEDELKVYLEQFRQQFKMQTLTNEQLQEDIDEQKLAEEEFTIYIDRLKSSSEQQAAANEQLQKEITERKQVEDDLKEYLNQLKQQIQDQITGNEKLREEAVERKKIEDELRKYLDELKDSNRRQATANEQLKNDIDETKRSEELWKEHLGQLKQRTKPNIAAGEKLQQAGTTFDRTDGDAAKNILLDRIKMLQNNKGQDVTEELLLTLSSLEKIISRQIQECRSASEKVLSPRSL